jgi:hypothetical protein
MLALLLGEFVFCMGRDLLEVDLTQRMMLVTILEGLTSSTNGGGTMMVKTLSMKMLSTSPFS